MTRDPVLSGAMPEDPNRKGRPDTLWLVVVMLAIVLAVAAAGFADTAANLVARLG